MKKNWLNSVLSLVLVFSVITCLIVPAAAEEASASEVLLPLMDLVSAASMYSANAPETVPGDNGILSKEFTDAFIIAGQYEGSEVGVTKEMLNDVQAQEELLSSIFAAKLPEFEAIEESSEKLDFIGFYPVIEEKLENDEIRFIGEVYTASDALRNLSEAEYDGVEWIDRALFTFRADENAYAGYRLIGFAFGTDLSYEEEFRKYNEAIAVEYQSGLGFMVLYPSCISDETLIENENGISGENADGTLKFSAKRESNSENTDLAQYVQDLSANIKGSTYSLNEEMQYATLRYSTEDGWYVFLVITVTDEYLYQAELSCKAEELLKYSMYFSYLENSFVIDNVSQG